MVKELGTTRHNVIHQAVLAEMKHLIENPPKAKVFLNRTLQSARRQKEKHSVRSVVIALVLTGLLYLALRNAPLFQIWNTLHQLQLWQILVILFIDFLIYLFVTARWWLSSKPKIKTYPIFRCWLCGLLFLESAISPLVRKWAASHCRLFISKKIWPNLYARHFHCCDG